MTRRTYILLTAAIAATGAALGFALGAWVMVPHDAEDWLTSGRPW